MKAFALGNRLSRDLNCKSFLDLSADARLEVVDAINGGIQIIDSLANSITKTTFASFPLAAPASVAFDVEQGSGEIAGFTFSHDQYGMTIQIEGDPVDNQISGPTELLHPYNGPTGTVTATVYSDAISMPEPYLEVVGNPVNLETGRTLTLKRMKLRPWQGKPVAEPYNYWVEPNARNRNSISPAVIRFFPLPDRAYRLEAEVSFAPGRVAFADLLSPGPELPIRAEYIEQYLLPICRGILTTSELWRDPSTKAAAVDAGKDAEMKFKTLSPSTMATPANECGTPYGY